MTIQINNEQQVVPEGATVHDVVVSVLRLNPAGMAIALNDSIVPKTQWETSRLQPDDKMLVIRASKGG